MQGPRHRRGQQDRAQPHPAAVEVEALVLDVIPHGLYNDPHREHRDGPVAQAIGVKRFTLLDGTPVGDIDLFDRVTLAREIGKTIPVPTPRGVRRMTITLGCLPGPESIIYCAPLKHLQDDVHQALVEAIESDTPRVRVVGLEDLAKAAEAKGLSPKILVVPRTPITYENLTNLARSNLVEAIKRIIASNEEFFVRFFNVAGLISIRQHALELLKGVGKRTVKQAIKQREKKPFTSFEEVKKVLKIDPVEALAEKIAEEIRGEAKYYLFIPPPDPKYPFFDYLPQMRGEKRQR
ncbi:MAG: DUF655 domain-containing protein [Desulfurococcales archaeon]|nr:DUF655 domain-containing protein [Desulfurococcales archaeon]